MRNPVRGGDVYRSGPVRLFCPISSQIPEREFGRKLEAVVQDAAGSIDMATPDGVPDGMESMSLQTANPDSKYGLDSKEIKAAFLLGFPVGVGFLAFQGDDEG
jgi:hypothetical protein